MRILKTTGGPPERRGLYPVARLVQLDEHTYEVHVGRLRVSHIMCVHRAYPIPPKNLSKVTLSVLKDIVTEHVIQCHMERDWQMLAYREMRCSP